MQVTGVRIDLHRPHPGHAGYERSSRRSELLAIFSLEFDSTLVVHGIKLIKGEKGKFLAMPSERIHDHCPQCSYKNYVLSNYCGSCGAELKVDRHLSIEKDKYGKIRLGMDLVHPTNSAFREMLLKICLEAYEQKSKEPLPYQSNIYPSPQPSPKFTPLYNTQASHTQNPYIQTSKSG